MTEPFPLMGVSVRVQPSLRPSRRVSILDRYDPILTYSFVHGLGAGLFLARADSDYSWKSNMGCDVAF
jgi:hypothetical protein